MGDKDPLDVCVLTEKRVRSGNLLLEAIPIGGFRMLDNGEVDDKIIAVLKNDAFYGDIKDVSECPVGVLNRLKHYFLTYKQIPSGEKPIAEITHLYHADEAQKSSIGPARTIRKNLAFYDKRAGPDQTGLV